MNLKAFKDSISRVGPPEGVSLALAALWWDAKGDWNKAHELAQEREDRAGNHVHAYLHRKEGDPSNAGYWYRRAGVSPSAASLEAEWDELVQGFLSE